MFLTETELKYLLAKNPSVRISSVSKVDKRQKTNGIPEQAKTKYWNVKVYVYEDGFVSELKALQNHGKIKAVFDSRREYLRHLQLTQWEREGLIADLERQVTLEIQPSFPYENETVKAILYKADFRYKQDGQTVIEDVKGYDTKTGRQLSTKDFKLKWKLLKYRYPDYKFLIF